MTHFLIAFLSLVISGFAGASEKIEPSKVDSSELSTIESKKVYQESEFGDLKQIELKDKFYAFFIRAINSGSIHNKLNEKYSEQKFREREDYFLDFPSIDLSHPYNPTQIKDSVDDEFSNSATDQVVQSSDDLSQLFAGYKFSFDFASPFRSEPEVASHKVQHTSQYHRTRLRLKTSENAPAKSERETGFGLVPTAETATKNDTNEYVVEKIEQVDEKPMKLSKFDLKLSPGVSSKDLNKEKSKSPSANLELAQYNEFYILTAPVDPNEQNDKGITHTLNLPIFKRLSLSQKIDYRGAKTETRLNNILASETAPSWNVVYNHLEHRYSSIYAMQIRKHSISFVNSFDSNWIVEDDKPLLADSSKYKVEYAYPF